MNYTGLIIEDSTPNSDMFGFALEYDTQMCYEVTGFDLFCVAVAIFFYRI